MIIVNVRQLVKLLFYFLAVMAVFVFYKTYGISMLFLLVVGLLVLKFVPALVIPIAIIALLVHSTGGFSFIADILEIGIVLIIGVPFCVLAYGCLCEIREVIKKKLEHK